MEKAQELDERPACGKTLEIFKLMGELLFRTKNDFQPEFIVLERRDRDHSDARRRIQGI